MQIPIFTCFDKNYVIPAAAAFRSMGENFSTTIEEAEGRESALALKFEELKNKYGVDNGYENLKNTGGGEYTLIDINAKDYISPAFYPRDRVSSTTSGTREITYKIFVAHTDISTIDQELLRETIAFNPSFSIEFINMNGRFEEEFKKASGQRYFSKEVLYKMIVAELFPNLDKIVITDVDVVFLSDIYQFYNLEFDTYFAGIGEKSAVGGGFLMANLTKIRKDNKQEEMIRCLIDNANSLENMEQDIINRVCTPHTILPLRAMVLNQSYGYEIQSKTYNQAEINLAFSYPVQLHYIDGRSKPWNTLAAKKADIFLSYLLKTPLGHRLLSSIDRRIIDNYSLELHLKYVFKRVIIFLKKYPKQAFKLSFYAYLFSKKHKAC